MNDSQRRIAIAALAGAILASCVTLFRFTGKEVDFFVMAGQSNMQGYMGDGKYFLRDTLTEDLKVHFYYVKPEKRGVESAKLPRTPSSQPGEYSSWPSISTNSPRALRAARRLLHETLEQPLEPVPSNTWTFLGPQWGRFPHGHFGPEVGFARALLRDGYSPAIFKYTRESTSLAFDWKAPGADGLYDDFENSLTEAVRALRLEGYQINMRGLIWIQGESDAAFDRAASEHEHRLRRVIERLRMRFIGDRAVIILGADEQHPSMRADKRVESAQLAIAATDPCVVRSSMVGLQKADFTHLTPSALIEHGYRLYESYKLARLQCQ